MIGVFTGEFRFLSNFHLAPVRLDGDLYPTVEHAYQASKTNNLTLRERIREAATPGRAKQLAKIEARPTASWHSERKEEIMLGLLRQKFAYTALRKKLLATGDQKLVEGNYWGDVYWGVCRGSGQNRLGKLLMKVRKEIRDGEVQA